MYNTAALSIPQSKKKIVDLFVSFIKEIDLPFSSDYTDDFGNHPEGVMVLNGVLVYDLERLDQPVDLLTLASRIAITRPSIRQQLATNGIQDDNLKEQREIAALLWCYAACTNLGVDPSILRRDHLKGEEEWLLDNFGRRNYIGLPLICEIGLTDSAIFPAMHSWIRR